MTCSEKEQLLLTALEESQSLFAAMLHESRSKCEIEEQMVQNCTALLAAKPKPKEAAPKWDGVINPSDFIVNTFSQGASGWIQKPDNCVRITHVPTGLFEEGTVDRSVHGNKAVAWERLNARLEKLAAAPDCLTCNDHGAVGNILNAEPCPDCTMKRMTDCSASNGETKAAHVQLPEPVEKIEGGSLKWHIPDSGYSLPVCYSQGTHKLYTEQQVRDILAQHGIN